MSRKNKRYSVELKQKVVKEFLDGNLLLQNYVKSMISLIQNEYTYGLKNMKLVILTLLRTVESVQQVGRPKLS